MSTVNIRHQIDQGAVQALFSSSSATAEDITRRAIRVMTLARDNLNGPPRRIDTGRLRASIDIGESPEHPAGVRVGTNVDYAIYVHDGTERMEANPFLLNAIDAAAD